MFVGAGPEMPSQITFDDVNATAGTGTYLENSLENQFIPQHVDIRSIWHTGYLTSKYSDCLPIAINHLLGCMWFQNREQVARITNKKLKMKHTKIVDYKERNGTCIDFFQNFICDEEHIYHFEQVFHWNNMDMESMLTVSEFRSLFNENEEVKEDLDVAFLVLNKYIYDGKAFKHSFVIKRDLKENKGLAIMDALYDHIFYTDSLDSNEKFTIENWLGVQIEFAVFVLKPTEYKDQNPRKCSDPQTAK